MEPLQAILLGAIQGLTEFLPVSSTAHLLLFSKLADYPDEGLAFDVVLHLGSALGLIVYFRKEIMFMIKDWVKSLFGQGTTFYSKLAWYLIVATIPVGLAGILFGDLIEGVARNGVLIGITAIIFGILLGLADFFSKRDRFLETIKFKDAVWVGLFQALAIIPGVSRSGITITAGRMMGLSRRTACCFGFLMSIPVILLAGLLQAYKLVNNEAVMDVEPLLIGFVVSAVVSFLTVFGLMKVIERVSMLPFAIYRVVLGCVLLYVFL